MICFSPHGTPYRAPIAVDDVPLRLDRDAWRLREHRWHGPHVLSFAFPRTAYAVLLLFDPHTVAFQAYYVNVQSPLARTEIGFDYLEQLLDARVSADRSRWSWKDENELEDAVESGLFTAEDADGFRRWGSQGVDACFIESRPSTRSGPRGGPIQAGGCAALPEGWDTTPSAEVIGADMNRAWDAAVEIREEAAR